MMRFLFLFAAASFSWIANGVDSVEDNRRFNCLPGLKEDQNICQKRGCTWQLPYLNVSGVPKCFFPKNYGYEVKGKPTQNSKSEYIIKLKRINTAHIYKDHAEELHVLIQSFSTHLRIKVYTSVERYEVPIPLFEGVNKKAVGKINEFYSWGYQENPFGIIVKRQNTGSVLWNTAVAPLIFADQFIQLSTLLPSKYLYGFGEHEHSSYKHDINWKSYGMFSRDQYPKPNTNLYGHHPFHLAMENDGNAHGVLLLNSNAMDVTLQPLPALTYRTIGGILDFYLFFGPTPEDVVKQYTLAVGRPFMPPYWSLGFQLSRWGYNSLERVKNVTQKMREYGIPQDVQYGDIDHMDRHIDFTYNKKTYAGLPEFVRSMKKDGLKYIIILDPAISSNETKPYSAYDYGVETDVFMKNEDNSTLLGKVWPYYPNTTIGIDYDWENQTKYFRAFAAFPDWTHPNATKYWTKCTKEHHKIIEYDALWIDMNEPANFITGRIQGCPDNNLEHPPYWPTLLADKSPKTLAEKSTCMTAKSYKGQKQYNSHSLYGLLQSKATYEALNIFMQTRPFVISRSTYPSNGKYAGHWLGDNLSAWEQMHKSIIGMLEFGLFGIPFIGADICGFRDTTTEALCQRWTQLGAFYPYSRNHNSFWAKPQDPPHFGAKFANEARYILLVRYTLLPYLYTLFYDAHTTGSTVVRPLMHEFVNEKETWLIDRQFLWGSALLINPVLDEGNTYVIAYFPKSRWYSYYNGHELKIDDNRKVNISAPKDFIPVYVRGGYIIPTQKPANNTLFSRKNSFGLIVALDYNGEAKGSLFWDDGESKDTIKNARHLKVDIFYKQNEIKWEALTNGYREADKLHISSVKIIGICGNVLKTLFVNGVVDGKGLISFNSSERVLEIVDLKLQITKTHIIKVEMDAKNVQGCPYRLSPSLGHKLTPLKFLDCYFLLIMFLMIIFH